MKWLRFHQPNGSSVRVSGVTALFAVTLFFGLLLGMYALAFIVLIKLFHISFWWGLAGTVAYVMKPRLNFKWSRNA